MLFVHPESREIVANQADPEGRLRKQGEMWTGNLPASEIMANMATDWSGGRWTMLIWPLPEDEDRRATLMLHELFHRVQDELGLPAGNPANPHLDEMAARVWLRLELEALRAALESEGPDQAEHLQSALIFRASRHRLFDGAAAEEAALERNEGLAEYTGVALAGRSPGKTRATLGEKIDGAADLPSLVRSFAYITGPIYGVLLDGQGSAWRRQITAQVGLGDQLARQRGLTVPGEAESEAEARTARYGGEAIRQAEDERERRRQERLAGYRRRLVDGPVLAIRLQAPRVQFNPNNLQPLAEHGTVYPTLRIADAWGILTVTGDALLDPSWSRVTPCRRPASTRRRPAPRSRRRAGRWSRPRAGRSPPAIGRAISSFAPRLQNQSERLGARAKRLPHQGFAQCRAGAAVGAPNQEPGRGTHDASSGPLSGARRS